MEFVTGKCPKCDGELQIPPERETIICMYCGAEIEAGQAVRNARERSELTEENKKLYAMHAKKAIERFPRMLFGMEDPLKNFKKNAYEGRFREYVKQNREVMDAIEDAYMASEEPEVLLRELSAGLLQQVNQKLSGQKNKRRQEDALMNYNMTLVIYLNPALADYNRKSGEPLVAELLKHWKKSFPKTNLKASTFDNINSGFKRRFCYITTAVCESLGKPDDCYELNVLRTYRDGYLRQQENGEELVKHYYDVAPTIVKRINKKSEHAQIYAKIWKDYLSPCIKMIEEDQNQKCMGLYTKMVEDLSEKYFN